MKTSWARLEDVFCLRLQKTSSRCLSSLSLKHFFKTPSRHLGQGEHIHLGHTSSEDVFKMTWSRRIYLPWSYVFKTFTRCLQDVFKTSSRNLQDVLLRRIQDVFKIYYQVKLFLLTLLQQDLFTRCFQDVFSTFFRRTTKTIIYIKICLGHTSEKCMVRVQIFQEWIFGYTETFGTVFLKHFMKWMLLQIKVFLLKLGIRKDVAVSVNKKSMNKCSSKNVFSSF